MKEKEKKNLFVDGTNVCANYSSGMRMSLCWGKKGGKGMVWGWTSFKVFFFFDFDLLLFTRNIERNVVKNERGYEKKRKKKKKFIETRGR